MMLFVLTPGGPAATLPRKLCPSLTHSMGLGAGATAFFSSQAYGLSCWCPCQVSHWETLLLFGLVPLPTKNRKKVFYMETH